MYFAILGVREPHFVFKYEQTMRANPVTGEAGESEDSTMPFPGGSY